MNGAKKKYLKKKPTLPKGEGARLIMKFMKNKKLSQAEICQALVKKHPDINKYVWNVGTTTLVRSGQLHKGADGLISSS